MTNAGSETRILRPGENCTGIYPVSGSGLLIDARDYYRAVHSAALTASRYILMAGWQFDSTVRLLRGDDEIEADEDTALLPFLNSLCGHAPDLHVYILAWDFTLFFSLDREWFQKTLFETWDHCTNIHFVYDSIHPVGGSHHQKLVVVDGTVAFVGGMDISLGRWDTPLHASRHPGRFENGKSYGPVHDVQSWVTGAAVKPLTEIFRQRWITATGTALELPEAPVRPFRPPDHVPIHARDVAVSRTRGPTALPVQAPIVEIRNLYRDAIAAADRLIYLENQYFTSSAVYDALGRRLADPERPRLQLILILPMRAHTLLEQASLAQSQAKHLLDLRRVAARYGHRLGVFSPMSGRRRMRNQIYIHSKVFIVDDRFMTIGSANTSNRSMAMDSELNLAWEAADGDAPLRESIARCRVCLLREHSGSPDIEDGDIISLLDRLARRRKSRLKRHGGEMGEAAKWLAVLGLHGFVDSERPLMDEGIYETLSGDSFFAQGFPMIEGLLSKIPPRSRLFSARGRRVLVILLPLVFLVLFVFAWRFLARL